MNIWEQSYRQTIGNVRGYKVRLRELLTWDKPLVEKANDINGKWVEWAKKTVALQNLIREQYPNMKLTINNHIVLQP